LEDEVTVRIISDFNRETRSLAALISAEGRLQAYRNLVDLATNAKSESVKLRANLALINLSSPFITEMEMDARVTLVEKELKELD
jgi:hypothetical protein